MLSGLVGLGAADHMPLRSVGVVHRGGVTSACRPAEAAGRVHATRVVKCSSPHVVSATVGGVGGQRLHSMGAGRSYQPHAGCVSVSQMDTRVAAVPGGTNVPYVRCPARKLRLHAATSHSALVRRPECETVLPRFDRQMSTPGRRGRLSPTCPPTSARRSSRAPRLGGRLPISDPRTRVGAAMLGPFDVGGGTLA